MTRVALKGCAHLQLGLKTLPELQATGTQLLGGIEYEESDRETMQYFFSMFVLSQIGLPRSLQKIMED